MKQIILFAICLLHLGTGRLFCQNIGINTTGTNANISALLEVGEAANLTAGGDTKGLLCPHVALTNITDVATITTPANGLIVYNTNAAMTNGNGVGLYFYCSSGCTTVGWKFMAAADNGPGTNGQMLTSQGAAAQAKWTTPVVMSAASGGQGSALGTTMQTAFMDSIGLFTPHANNCAGTEAFVPLYSGATVGFCIEKSERVAAFWTDAKRTCMALGKRLPEPEEFQVACDNAGALGILTMTNNWEWASNFALPMYNGASFGLGAAIFGVSGCDYASWSWLGGSPGGRGSHAFRCVH